MKTCELSLKVLTCVHIGSGEEIMPMEYGVFPSAQGHRIFCRFSPARIVSSLEPAEKKRFSALAEKDDFRETAAFLRKKAQALPASILYGMNATGRFAALFDEKADDPTGELKVFPAYRPPGNKSMVLPASSIKGALRTAVLEGAVRTRTAEPSLLEAAGEGKDREFQSAAFRHTSPRDDPFRLLSISDMRLEGKALAQIAGCVVNYSERREAQAGKGMRILIEAARGELLGGEAEGKVPCELKEFRELLEASAERWRGIQRPLTIANLVKDCDRFYRSAFEEEAKRFFRAAGEPKLREAEERLRAAVESIKPENGEFLIRIGRYSQAEFVTVNPPFRHLKRPAFHGARDSEAQSGETRSRMLFEYESGLWPIGYCRGRIG